MKGDLLGQHHHRLAIGVQRAIAHHDEILRGVLDAHLAQRFHGLRDHAQRLARFGKLPASDGDHAVGLQVLEVFAEGFDGVEVVLAEGEGPGGGGSPGIHQRHLHDVVLIMAVADERTAIADVHVHFGNLVEVIGVIGEAVAHDVVGDDGIDFDAGDVGAAIRHRAQHIHTAARADDGEVTARAQHVGQRRRSRHQIAPVIVAPMMRVGIHQVGAGVGVDDDGLGPALVVDFDSRQRVPARVKRARCASCPWHRRCR